MLNSLRQEGKGYSGLFQKLNRQRRWNNTEIIFLYRNPCRVSTSLPGHMSGMYIECVRSQKQKNSLRKQAKECSGPPQKRANGLQIACQTPSESKAVLEHPSGLQKEHYFLAGPPMGEAIDTPKWFPRVSRTTQKSIVHGRNLLASVFCVTWSL